MNPKKDAIDKALADIVLVGRGEIDLYLNE